MKLVNFFENSKLGSGFQEPSESGCLGKQIKKGKAKKKVSEDQSYDDLRVAKYLCYNDGKKFKGYGTQSDYISKAESMREENPEKYQSILRQPSPPSDDSWRSKLNNSVENDDIQLEEMDMPDISDEMIGTPDNFYDEEQRKEAYKDMIEALDDCRHDWQRETVVDGICPECSGSSCMDGDDENGEDSCYGWGNFGCSGGEMTQNDDGLPNWAEIIKHDKRNAERQKAKADYPGDEAIIDQIAKAVKQLDDPRQMFQYMQADYPHMGRAQRSNLISQGMKKAGLTSESITEGEERSIIADACVEKLVDEFSGRENQFENKEDFEYAIYQALEDLDVKDCVDPEMEVGGQPIGDFASGRVIDCCSSSDIIYDVMANMDESQIGEGTIDQTFATDNIDKHDKKSKQKKEDDKESIELEIIRKLSGVKVDVDVDEGRPYQNLGISDIIKLPNGKEYIFKPEKGMFIGTDTTYPGGQEEVDPTSRTHKELLRLRRNQAARFKGVKEDAEGDSSESAVSKMIAKALGDENRWTEMSAAELYAELESENTDMADIVKDVAKMIYGVKLAESKVKYHDSSECSCKCGKPVCGACGRPHRPEDIKKYEGAEDFYTKLTALIHDEEAYAKACGMSMKKLDQEMGEISRDLNLHMDDDRNEIIMRHAQDQEEKFKNKVEEEITLEDNQDFHEEFGVLGYSEDEEHTFEAEYRGRKVKLNKPTRGDVKKFKVYVKDPKTGNVKKVNFGHGGTSAKRKTMRIRKSNPKARKSFRARHNCSNPGPKTKARYWSCRKW